MKKLVCHFLIVWMALFAGGANAHGSSDLAQGPEHAGHAHNTSGDLNTQAVADQTDANQAGADITANCSQTHCGHGHGHCIGMLTLSSRSIKIDSAADAPISGSRWASAAIVDNIERPKWPVATPAVVSLLG